jgi:hypothetical protein
MTAAIAKKYSVHVLSVPELCAFAEHLPEGPDDFAELFSPPRICPLITQYPNMKVMCRRNLCISLLMGVCILGTLPQS